MHMKVLITGAAGFQAKFVIERLREKHELTLFDIVDMQPPGRFIKGDITKYEDVENACKGQDAVVHRDRRVGGESFAPMMGRKANSG
jgi:nucleoside-diphosphate-sugar epimerase